MSVLNRMQALFWPRISLQNLTPNKIGTLSSPGKLSLSSVLFSHLVVSDSLSDSMNHSTPGLPVHHQHPESTQTPVHWVSDAIQTSHPLLSPSPPALNLSQHQGLFKWVSSSHQVAKVLEFQLQHQSNDWCPFKMREIWTWGQSPPGWGGGGHMKTEMEL